jgi:1-deoxy-D-xylulose-5-phosphate reductoisomerase
MAAITGATSLKPTLAAAKRGATVALANKECLVCAGALFMRQAAAAGAKVLPVDSEHNAIFQALGAGRREDVRRIMLTASGGPFRTWPLEAMRKVTVEQALKHPTWSMGPKVTIDSATLMNKGLELIEAHHLFALGPQALDVVVHSPVRRPRAGGVSRRFGGCPVGLPRHADPDRALSGLAGAHGYASTAA